MKQPEYDNLLVLDPEVNGIGKSFEQTPPEVLVRLPVQKWIPRYLPCTRVEYAKELLAQACGFLFIPHIAGYDIIFDFRAE
jgi:hypothetical protein